MDDVRINPLLAQLAELETEQWDRHRINFFANWGLVFLAVASTIGATAGGTLKWSHEWITLIGIVGTAAVALQKAFSTEAKSELQRALVAEAKVLRIYLADPALTEDEFKRYRDKLAALVTRAGSFKGLDPEAPKEEK